MKIVHFSDWHSEFDWKLPGADVYVCSGDMLPNFPLLTFIHEETGEKLVVPWSMKSGLSEKWLYSHRHVNVCVEQSEQNKWLDDNYARDTFRQRIFGSPDAPVICVRGNHDFINLSPLFGGEVYEIHELTDVFEIKGIKFGGMRGINYIAGEWSDELKEDALLENARQLPLDIDVLVTHAPPAGTLDLGYGVTGLRSYLDRAAYYERSIKAHLFGHIHLYGGTVEERQWGDRICKLSNAACTYTVVEV